MQQFRRPPPQIKRPLPTNNFAPKGPMTMGGGAYQTNMQAPFQPQMGGPNMPFNPNQMAPLPEPGFQAPMGQGDPAMAPGDLQRQVNLPQSGMQYDSQRIGDMPKFGADQQRHQQEMYQSYGAQQDVNQGAPQQRRAPDFRNLSRAQMMQQYQQMTGQQLDPNMSKARALHQVRMANRNMTPNPNSRGILTKPPLVNMPGKLVMR